MPQIRAHKTKIEHSNPCKVQACLLFTNLPAEKQTKHQNTKDRIKFFKQRHRPIQPTFRRSGNA